MTDEQIRELAYEQHDCEGVTIGGVGAEPPVVDRCEPIPADQYGTAINAAWVQAWVYVELPEES